MDLERAQGLAPQADQEVARVGGPGRAAVGARVVINGRITRSVTVGGATWSSYSGDLLVGLGSESLRTLEVHWPSGDGRPERFEFDPPICNRRVPVERGAGDPPLPSDAPAER